MGRFGGSHSLLAICGPLLVLLAALAVVQYRWSTRVASAAAQREKEHLDSAASLFASEFNGIVEQASAFVQNDARVALDSGQRLVPVPRVIGELDYIEIPAQGGPHARRLSADGLFAPSPMPEWIAVPRCAPLATSQPPALVVPVYDVATEDGHGAAGTRIRKAFKRQEDRCFVARIDQCYLHDTLFPRLIRRTFGPTASREYDFAVVPLGRPTEALYGAPLLRDDLEKPFFSLAALLAIAKHSALADAPQAVFIQRVETGITDDQMRVGDPFGRGIWELKVAHKGLPLPAAFERTRRLDLLLSWGVELLLGAAVVLLVIGTRRIELLAEQKMRFVAGVSHELRTPVSAISMLSRNQADGLLADPEKVKQYGELIHQRSRRLNEMVEQTLQYAGIQSVLHRPTKDEVDLARLIQEAVDARRDELVRAGFEIQIALPPDLPAVWGDAPLLRIALDNLLSNAQKHASAGHWIRVSAGVSAPEREVRISVEDHGDGIDPTEQAEIFEPFSRGRAATEAQIPGSGLGLSLARSAAEAHRGSVTLVSEPGRGSAFTIHLPL